MQISVVGQFAETAIDANSSSENPPSYCHPPTLVAQNSIESPSAPPASFSKKNVVSAFALLQWNPKAQLPADSRRSQSRKRKKANSKELTQLYLDFGQKDFDSKTCSVCHMMYCPGLPKEELLHRRFHMVFTNGVEFRGWKNERIVASFEDGDRIVCVYSTDEVAHRKKAEEVFLPKGLHCSLLVFFV